MFFISKQGGMCMSKRSTGIIWGVAGFIIGILITLILIWQLMPGMMIKEGRSPYDMEKTIAMVKQNAEELGWKIPKVYNFQKSISEAGEGDVGKITVIELCQPEYAHDLLKNPDSKFVSVLMPCAIAIYEKNDGVYVSSMQVGTMGKIFGGNINTVMTRVSEDDHKILEFVE
jgi:uncharacterized protein (DUF302 family)